MTTLIADVESNNFLHEMTHIWCIGITDIDNPDVVDVYVNHKHPDVPHYHKEEYPSLELAYERLQAADRVVFHNALGFDYWAINMMAPGTLRFEQIWDSLVVSRLEDPERREHSIAAYGNEFGYPKGDYKDFDRFGEDLIPYMEKDVEINVRIYQRLQQKLNDWYAKGVDFREAITLEHQVEFCLALQNQHGFNFDLNMARELESDLATRQMELLDELQRVFPPRYKPKRGRYDFRKHLWCDAEYKTPKVSNSRYGYDKGASYTPVELQAFNPGSDQQVARRLSEVYRWKPSKFTPTGQPQVTEDTLKSLEGIPEAEVFMSYLRTQKMLSQLSTGNNAWLKLERNGRIHGYVKSCGCRTHRMSHFGPNTAQVDKEMREFWKPDYGHDLVGCDAAGLELRMLAAYLAYWDGGRYADIVLHGDVHTENQKAAGLTLRDSAKTFIYALIYGAGDSKLGEILNDDRGTREPTTKLGKKARSDMESGITGLGQLVKMCKDKERNLGFVKGPDGRAIRTAGQHSALNTLLQGAGAIVMKKALAIHHFEVLPERGLVDRDTWLPIGDWCYVANVHDEVQMTSPPQHSETLGVSFKESIRLAGEAFDMQCPLDGEYLIGTNWKETH